MQHFKMAMLLAFVVLASLLVDPSTASEVNSLDSRADSLVLQDTSIVFGALTPAGRGAVRLSAQDSSFYAAPFSGLGLLPSTSAKPARWRLTPSSMSNASASHWTLPSAAGQWVAEGQTALTPTPSTAGDAANLNLGPYKFLVEAMTADNRAFKSAYLTITIQARAANLGTYDTASALILGNYANNPGSWDGDTILLSTGLDRTNVTTGFYKFYFSKTVTFKHADPKRPGGIISLGFSLASNVVVTGISFTGDLTRPWLVTSGVVIFQDATNMAVRFCNFTYGMNRSASSAAIRFWGCINCEASDIYARAMDTGIYDSQAAQNVNIAVKRFRMREFYNNAIWVGNSKNMSFTDCATIGPVRNNGLHIDHIQVADGAAPQGLSFTRHQMYKAEGNGGAQGFFTGTPGIYEGFIDDGTGNGAYTGRDGNVMTITKIRTDKPLVTWTWLRGYNFSQLIQVTKPSSTGKTIGTYVIDKVLKAPPGVIHTAPLTDLSVNGMAYTGWMRDVLWLRGLAGRASIKAYTATMVTMLPSEISWSYFKGTLVGSTLTVTEFQWGDAPVSSPMFLQFANGSLLSANQNQAVVNALGTGLGGVGTYTVSGSGFNYPQVIALRGTPDIPNTPSGGPACDILGVDMPSMYSPGGGSLSSLYMFWSDYGRGGLPTYREYMGGSTNKPASLSIDAASTFFNTGNSTAAALVFAQGDPQYGPQGLQTLTNAQWAKLSFDEVLKRHAAALTPRVGGRLTFKTQDFGAFTRNGMWNDGSGKDPSARSSSTNGGDNGDGGGVDPSMSSASAPASALASLALALW